MADSRESNIFIDLPAPYVYLRPSRALALSIFPFFRCVVRPVIAFCYLRSARPGRLAASNLKDEQTIQGLPWSEDKTVWGNPQDLERREYKGGVAWALKIMISGE
jgi:hypothetical protein